jgi:hypothetical protein
MIKMKYKKNQRRLQTKKITTDTNTNLFQGGSQSRVLTKVNSKE